MDVIVYHGNGCRACHEEMEYLKHDNVPFIAKNVHNDPENALASLLSER
jgi:glutaredoxin